MFKSNSSLMYELSIGTKQFFSMNILFQKCDIQCTPFFVQLYRYYPYPVSIDMSAFINASRFRTPARSKARTEPFCASFRLSWCSFIAIRALSVQLSMSLHRGFFPPTFIEVSSLPSSSRSLPSHLHRYYFLCNLLLVSSHRTVILLNAFMCFVYHTIYIIQVMIYACRRRHDTRRYRRTGLVAYGPDDVKSQRC